MWLFRNSEFVKQIGLSAAGTLLAGLSAGILWGREAFAAALLSSLFWCIAHLRREIRRFQGMRLLAGQIDELLHGSDIPEFKHFHEGDLEILRDEIYKMTIRLKEQAALLQKEKSSLADALADISHQIRTPLTALNILLERLKSPELDIHARRHLLREAGTLLARIEWLVTALLKMSKLEAGSIALQKETELKITDSGPGIPREDLPHLFERFYRGKNAGKDSFGIGLALAQMILSRENAVIQAQNAPEGGGQFRIRFYKTMI